MNIPFVGRRSGTFTELTDEQRERQARIAAAPKTGPRRGKLLSPGQQARAWRRQRSRDLAAMSKKSRRKAFLNQQRDFHLGENVVGMARVYFYRTGTPEMQANVDNHIEFLAERLSKSQSIPFSKAVGMIEDRLREELEAREDDELDQYVAENVQDPEFEAAFAEAQAR